MRRVQLISLLLLLLLPSLVLAQGECPVIVQTALTAANTFCGGAGRNEACYGNVSLTAQPQPDVTDFQFEAPGDIEGLTDIQTMQLSSQIEEEGVWGIALLRVQANLPDTLPGQNVTLLLFGDAQIEDASNEEEVAARLAGEVPADDTADAGAPPTATPMPTIAVTANGGANVRAGASTEAGVVAGLTAGQTVTAVGRNEAGDWLQIRVDGTVGWVATRLVAADGDVSTLPVTQSGASSGGGTSATSAEAAGGEIRPGQTITGTITNAEPMQYFTFAAESGDVVTITLQGGGSGLDPFLGVLGPNGNIVASNDDSSGLDSAVEGLTLGASGEYTIMASRFGQEDGSSTGAYELTLTLDSAASYGPMQAFYFRTGIGDAPCAEAPDSGILVQSPGGAGVVNLRVNEVEIQLASSIYLQAQPNNEMIINVIEGQARATAFGVSVVAPAGTRIRVPMDGRPAASGPPVGPESYGNLGPLPVDNLLEPIEIAEPLPASALTNIGEVEMTLTWSDNADLDLHVYEPNGEEIWFGRTVTSSGGELSSDENIECVGTGSYTETVHWPRGGALFGDYRVTVDVYDNCGAGNPSWTLVVNVDGEAVVSEEGSGNAEFSFTR